MQQKVHLCANPRYLAVTQRWCYFQKAASFPCYLSSNARPRAPTQRLVSIWLRFVSASEGKISVLCVLPFVAGKTGQLLFVFPTSLSRCVALLVQSLRYGGFFFPPCYSQRVPVRGSLAALDCTRHVLSWPLVPADSGATAEALRISTLESVLLYPARMILWMNLYCCRSFHQDLIHIYPILKLLLACAGPYRFKHA